MIIINERLNGNRETAIVLTVTFLFSDGDGHNGMAFDGSGKMERSFGIGSAGSEMKRLVGG